MTTHQPDETGTEAGSNDGSTDMSRRRLLQATATTAVGGAGIAGATGTASATGFTGCDDWLEAPAEYPEIDLTSSNPTAENIDDIEGELLIYVHGWLGLETNTDQAYTLETALEDNEYDEPVVAAAWEADTLNYWRAEDTTETAGRRLAAWLRSDRVDLEETTVRLVGHSLGGRVCLEALAALGDEATVEHVALVGTAADDDSVCTDGEYAYGIATGAESVYNYHSENDDKVCYGYDIQSLASGLGCGGADCDGGWVTDDSGSVPDNYTDVDVTDTVDDHCDYVKPDVGCVSRIVDDFEAA
ncbi:alpha/beta hydrolase [Natronolimnohabitans sp. A-GB9]|uniref:esterase/lipase family protein n=1 Tax=Natronolimnohabitans sp. A-GB9 TaxID=3069757 RepID=UPI0027B06290|nr:alpha/beta hydrolase [Natronolimnohabitans sp. A-GB9]MDQ2052343.1 alpha/beta hydrolase [Natronolimnohabitans sp. A-GB9]